MTKRGVITFVFDDGYEHVFKNIVPLLNQHKVRGVFAVPIENDIVARTEGLPVTSWQEWVKVKANGHEIASHSVSHPSLPHLFPEQLEKELNESARLLQATTLVYPGGAYDSIVLEQTKKLYRAARTVKKGFETLPPQNPFELKTYNFTRHDFTVAKANLLALWAYLTNTWLIETYHTFLDEKDVKVHNVPLAQFKKHLTFVSRLPIEIKTIREAISPETHP